MTTLHGEEIRLKDKAWSIRYGWGEVAGFNYSPRPVRVKFKHFEQWYTEDGTEGPEDIEPTLFWDEVHIAPPPKPKRMVRKWLWAYESQETTGLSKYKSEPDANWRNSQKLEWTEVTEEE